MKKYTIVVGQEFGQLTAVKKCSPGRIKKHSWLCTCLCGSKGHYLPYRLATGKSWRCPRCAKRSTQSRLTHGRSKTPLYSLYMGILNRCYNQNEKSYKDYGGRGIKVCRRWLGKEGFEHFRADMGEPPSGMSIERKNNDKDYSPENCIWADRKVQSRNRRSNIRIAWEGQEWVLLDLANHLGLPYATVSHRIRDLGWPIARALTEPINSKFSNRKLPCPTTQHGQMLHQNVDVG